jgi:hypothetical protein
VRSLEGIRLSRADSGAVFLAVYALNVRFPPKADLALGCDPDMGHGFANQGAGVSSGPKMGAEGQDFAGCRGHV